MGTGRFKIKYFQIELYGPIGFTPPDMECGQSQQGLGILHYKFPATAKIRVGTAKIP
jgi:hypothetical protein